MTNFPSIYERRYTKYPRRYTNEYTWDGRVRDVSKYSFKSNCATLAGARQAALRAIENYSMGIVRIFDRRTGRYINTYKRTADGITRYAGAVK